MGMLAAGMENEEDDLLSIAHRGKGREQNLNWRGDACRSNPG